MHEDKAGREELRRPGVRRILDALKAIEDEQPGLLGKASLGAGELVRRHGDAGRLSQQT
jgi:hypothetical protein